MKYLLATLCLTVGALAFAQDACESRCNQAQAACLKECVGKPEQSKESKKMVVCLRQCTEQTKPCRDKCAPPPAAHHVP